MLSVIMECRISFIVMLSVFMLNVVMLSVFMLNVVTLSGVILSVVMLNVVAPMSGPEIRQTLLRL